MNTEPTAYASLFADPSSRDIRSEARSGGSGETQFQELLQRQLGEQGGASPGKGPEIVRLGSISRESPTVSHLLMQNPEYRERCWEIVHDPSNRGKGFREMEPGTTVWLNPDSGELVWQQESPTQQSTGTESQTVTQSISPGYSSENAASTAQLPSSRDLDQSMEKYLGTPYSRLNCYELVVQGLRDIGVRYSGRDGLQQELMQRARSQDLDPNTYLTGDGLIRSLSSPVLQREYTEVSQPQRTAEELMRTLEERLEPGMILSVSSPDRGHTGMISRKQGQWTLINSGRIEHPVQDSGVRHGVSEEHLGKELLEWLRRGKEDGGLSITIGRLDPDKLSRYTDPPSRELGSV